MGSVGIGMEKSLFQGNVYVKKQNSCQNSMSIEENRRMP